MKFGSIEKFLLFGGGKVLSQLSLYLKKKGYDITVITSPRHKEENVGDSNFADFLEKNSIDYILTESVSKDKNVLELITGKTLGLSFGAAWIFKDDFINRFKGKLLNVHGARLPKNRGAGGFSWRILRGDTTGACLIHQVVEEIDAGDVITVNDYVFPDSCRLPSDFESYQQEKDLEFLKSFVEDVVLDKEFSPHRQDEGEMTYFPRLYTPKHGAIDWDWSVSEIEAFIRAFDNPYPGAFTFLDGKKVCLKNVRLANDGELFHPFIAGLIYRICGDEIFIATRDEGIVVKSVLDEVGNDLRTKLLPGYRFYTSRETLEEARQFRAVYTAKGIKLPKE